MLVFIVTGAMTDPYIPLEETLEYTRTCLHIIDRHHFGLAILTKSNHTMHDIDFIQSINKNAKCVVQMTLTTYDETLCAITTLLNSFDGAEKGLLG